MLILEGIMSWTLLGIDKEPKVIEHTHNPSTQEAEEGGVWVQVYTELCTKILSQKQFLKTLLGSTHSSWLAA